MTGSRKGNAILMRVVNKLTKPGDIRRVDLMPDTVRIQTSDGQARLYTDYLLNLHPSALGVAKR